MGVYTKLEENEKCYLEEMYSINIEKINFINTGILNSNFLLKSKNEKFILRIFEANRTLEEEEQELKLLDKISEFIPVSKALKNKNNAYISEYNNKKMSIFNFIEGENISLINQTIMRELAWYLGKFHKYSLENSIENFTRKTRIDLDFYVNEIKKSKITFEGEEKFFKIFNELKEIDFSSLPSGIIHSDIFPDNVILKNNHIEGIIDFNESYFAPFIYDIAIVINFWIKINNFGFQKENEFIRDFLNNYSRHRKILPEEIKLLNKACKKMALTFIALRIYKEKIDRSFEKALDIEEKSYLSLLSLLV